MLIILFITLSIKLLKCTNRQDKHENQVKKNIDKMICIPDSIKNFDYNTLFSALHIKYRLPYINCNRGIFCKPKNDLADIFMIKSNSVRIETLTRIRMVGYTLKLFISRRKVFVFKEIRPSALKHLENNNPIFKSRLNFLIFQLSTVIRYNDIKNISKGDIYEYFKMIEFCIFDSFDPTLYSYPINVLSYSNIIYKINQVNPISIRTIVVRLMHIYKQYSEDMSMIQSNFSMACVDTSINDNKLTQFDLKQNILWKYVLFCREQEYIDAVEGSKESEDPRCTIIYSINVEFYMRI